jgi:hypothetical protein
MNSFFNVDPNQRPTFESLRADEWMNGHEISYNELFAYMNVKADQRMQTDIKRQ